MSSISKSADQKSTTESTAAPRFVPGAPPPAPLTKSQKKKLLAKRKPAPADHSAAPPEGQDGSVRDGPDSAPPEAPHESDHKVSPEDEVAYKPSPLAELINKRLKSTTKKITRISTYAAMDVEKLDDGQRQAIRTLPGLEAIQKELGEVKKLVETYEMELAHEEASKRIEAELAEKKKIADTLSAAQASYAAKASDLLSFLRLHGTLSNGASEGFDDATIASIAALAEVLLSREGDAKRAVIHGLLSGEGDFRGTSYAKYLEILHLWLNPPRVPTPIPEEVEEQEEEIPMSMESTTVIETDSVTGGIAQKPSTGSFHFMQASELESGFEETAEWVERSDAIQVTEEPNTTDEAADQTLEPESRTFNQHPETSKEPPAGSGPIDWADEEGGLPSIDVLQAKFGQSGSVTPITPAAEGVPEGQNPTAVNGIHADGAHEEEDGFTQARGGRGRGRGFKGDRGARGSFRGPVRGGDRGFRGGFRGGDRERGGFRGRSTPSGEWRGDNEYRGRGSGRGRGRGGDRGGRGEVATPAA